VSAGGTAHRRRAARRSERDGGGFEARLPEQHGAVLAVGRVLAGTLRGARWQGSSALPGEAVRGPAAACQAGLSDHGLVPRFSLCPSRQEGH